MRASDIAAYAGLAAFAGALVPVAAALMGAMGRTMQSTPLAALIVAAGAFAITAAFALAASGGNWRIAAAPSLLQACAGAGIAIYILSMTFLAPRFGVANAVMVVILAQLASSAAIDHFALFGAARKPIDLQRAAGVVIMAIGLIIAQSSVAAKS